MLIKYYIEKEKKRQNSELEAIYMKNYYKKRSRKFTNNVKGRVSVILGTVLMIAIITSAMSVYVKVSSDSNQRTYELNDVSTDIHAELLEEMEAFYDNLLGKIAGIPGVPENQRPIIVSVEPIPFSADVVSAMISIKVNVVDSESDETTVWFYPWGESVSNPIIKPQIKTIRGGGELTFNFPAMDSGVTYYWSVALNDPWHLPYSELYSFTTA